METLNLTTISGPFAGSGELCVSDDRIVTMLTVVETDLDCQEERLVVWQDPFGFVAARLVGTTIGWDTMDWIASDEYPVLTFQRMTDLPAVLTYLMSDDLFAEVPENAEVL